MSYFILFLIGYVVLCSIFLYCWDAFFGHVKKLEELEKKFQKDKKTNNRR